MRKTRVSWTILLNAFFAGFLLACALLSALNGRAFSAMFNAFFVSLNIYIVVSAALAGLDGEMPATGSAS